jgi:hypothetical protein
MNRDPLIEAKLERMMIELQQSKPLPEAEIRSVPEQKQRKPTIKHHFLDWKNRFVLPIEILAIPWAQFIIAKFFFKEDGICLLSPDSFQVFQVFFCLLFRTGAGHILLEIPLLLRSLAG